MSGGARGVAGGVGRGAAGRAAGPGVVPVAVLIAALAAFLAAGCGREQDRGEAGKPGPEEGAPEGVEMTTRAGEFSVVWPSGCDRLVTRRQEEQRTSTGTPPILYVYCDRAGRENEGAGVRAHYQLSERTGQLPTPRTVVQMVEDEVRHFQARIVAQKPVQHGPLQGVQVLGRQAGGTGEVWIEGLLLGDSVYILTAWKGSGGLFEDPEYARFFESFSVGPPREGAPGGEMAPPDGAAGSADSTAAGGGGG